MGGLFAGVRTVYYVPNELAFLFSGYTRSEERVLLMKAELSFFVLHF